MKFKQRDMFRENMHFYNYYFFLFLLNISKRMSISVCVNPNTTTTQHWQSTWITFSVLIFRLTKISMIYAFWTQWLGDNEREWMNEWMVSILFWLYFHLKRKQSGWWSAVECNQRMKSIGQEMQWCNMWCATQASSLVLQFYAAECFSVYK